MPEPLGQEPIGDDEFLYRRIPVSTNWCSGGELSPEAFDPRKDDLSGISLTRSKYRTPHESAVGSSRRGYYVAACSVRKLREAGFHCAPEPIEDNPGHAEITDVRFGNRESDRTKELKLQLANLFKDNIQGPFLSDAEG